MPMRSIASRIREETTTQKSNVDWMSVLNVSATTSSSPRDRAAYSSNFPHLAHGRSAYRRRSVRFASPSFGHVKKTPVSIVGSHPESSSHLIGLPLGGRHELVWERRTCDVVGSSH